MDKDDEKERPPGPEVLAAIQAALAEPRTLKVVFGYARRRAFLLRKFGVGIDLNQDDLVNQVIVDTVRGRLTWNPETVALSTHLRCDFRADVEAPEPAQACGVGDGDRQGDGEAWGQRLPTGELVALRDVVRKVKDYLFRAATVKGDEGVQFLLMAYEEGIEGRSAIGDATGLSPSDVTNARKRLDRLIAELPPELVEAARKVIN